jgi:salicylate hydroxylase
MPRTRRTVLGSRMRARENHLASPLARLVRDAKFALRDKFGADRTAFQAAWLYEYDVARDPALKAREPAGAA